MAGYVPKDKHTIHHLAEGEVEMMYKDGGTRLGIIDEDEYSDDPIFAIAYPNGSYVVFCFPEDSGNMRVLHVNSESDGDMGRMLDQVTQRFGEDSFVIFNVVNKKLADKLYNSEMFTVNFGGEDIKCLAVKWDN
jgi:hypothetical protein